MNKELIFVCLGDSLTAGSPGFNGFPSYRGNPESQYEFWLQKIIEENHKDSDIEIINFGVGGNTTWNIFQRYRRDITQIVPDADYIIVWIGINDIIGIGMKPEEIISNLEDIYDLIQKSGSKIIAVEIAPGYIPKLYTKRIIETNRMIRNLAQKYKTQIVPLYNALLDSKKLHLKSTYDIGDGVHFNVAGYKKIAAVIYHSVLKEIIDK